MKKFSFFIYLALPVYLASLETDSQFKEIEVQQTVNFHNRPLIKVNNKTISMVDVIKRLDMQLLKQAPHILNNESNKLQYYNANWRSTFLELVEQQLVLLDSEQMKFSISEGDIREELDTTIGNNLISKLDSIGVNVEEAREMVETDMKFRQMLWFKAYSKAMQAVTPEMIKETYAEVVKRDLLKQKEQWCYQVLTVKAKDSAKSDFIANEAYQLLSSSNSIISNIPEILKTTFSNISTDYDITVSKDIVVDSNSIASQHYDILKTLKENEYSKPITQQIKNSKEPVQRIYYLKNHSKEELPTFDKISSNLKDKLIQMNAEHEKKIYIDALKAKYFVSDFDLQEAAPKDFDPFLVL